jgi:phosphonate metabolism protein PhnN/1,5-bisphosphokinase (PRPP-forming)
MARGTLFLIVGASGAGKDSLIHGAREALAANEDYLFARRTITRPIDPAREIHEELSGKEFARRAKAGDFMASWNAYKTDYGISSDYAADLKAGQHVVANVSRETVGNLAAHYRPVCVIQITAPPALLEQRLRARGDAKAAAERLSRAVVLPDHISVNHLLNAGSLEKGVNRLVTFLTTLSKP